MVESATACCVSGAALGAALASLLAQLSGRKPARRHRFAYADDELCDEPTAGYRGKTRFERQTSGASDRFDRQVSIAADTESGVNYLGFTMEEARQHTVANAAKAKEKSPEEVMQELQKGNTRFWMGISSNSASSAFQRRALISQQYPSVAILSCSDSRVPTEIIFDQGLGAMFVVRVAGNCLDTGTLASLQYAVCHLKVKVLLVMGHEGCGAVKAAGLPLEKIKQEPEELCQTLKTLKRGLNEEFLSDIHDRRAHDREAVVTNVLCQIERLSEIDIFAEAVHRKELFIVGAFYEISSGIVDFIEVTQGPMANSLIRGRGWSRFEDGADQKQTLRKSSH